MVELPDGFALLHRFLDRHDSIMRWESRHDKDMGHTRPTLLPGREELEEGRSVVQGQAWDRPSLYPVLRLQECLLLAL